MKRRLVLLFLGLCLAQVAGGAASHPVNEPHTASAKVRIDFRDASVLEVIRVLSELSGINITATEKAGKINVTIFLQDLPVEAALDAVCKSAGLWYRKETATGLWRIMTLEEYQRDIVVYRAEQTRVLTLRNTNVVAAANAVSALFGARVKLTAGVQESAGIGGAGAAASAGSAGAAGGSGAATPAGAGSTLTSGQIAATLDRLGAEAGSAEREDKLADTVIRPPSVFITYNLLHNLLIVRSSDLDAVREIEQLVSQLDRPTRQVLLEMKVLEITLGDSFRSVFDFGLTGGPAFTGPAVGHPPNPLVPNAPGSQVTLGTGNFPLEGGTFVFQLMNDRILARIQLLASENKVKVLSTPLLLASNNQSAKLFIGEERVLTTGATSNTVTNANQTVTTFNVQTEKRNIGNTLTLLPRINADRTVTLSILQDASNVLPKSATILVGSAGSVQEFPIDTVSTANLQVTVIAKDRLALAVGGMIRERTADAESKVPLLGDIPILGALFKRKVKENLKTEMVLMITPYIIDNPEEGEQRSRERLDALTGLPEPLDGMLRPGPESVPEPLATGAASDVPHAKSDPLIGTWP